MKQGLGLWISNRGGTSGPSVIITNLTNGVINQNDFASIGTEMSNGDPITSPKWGSTLGGTQFGTGANPTDLTALAQGAIVYFEGVYDGDPVYKQVASYEPVTFDTPIPDQSPDLDSGNVDIDLLTYAPLGVSFSVTGGSTSIVSTTTLRIPTDTQQTDTNVTVTAFTPLSETGVSDTFILNISSGVFAAEANGSNLLLSNVPDVSDQTFTSQIVGADLVITLTGEIIMPLPTQALVVSVANHDNTNPDTGSYTTRIVDLGTPVDNTYTIGGVSPVEDDMVVLLSSQRVLVADPVFVVESDNSTILMSWFGTLNAIDITGSSVHTGTYTTYHDGSDLAYSSIEGFAGRALNITATTGDTTTSGVLTAGDVLVISDIGQETPVVTGPQWQRNGVDIPGETGATYTKVGGDAGANIRPTWTITAAGETTVVENGSSVAIDAVTTDAVEFAAVIEYSGGNADPQFYSVDFSTLGYQAGDLLIFGSGVTRQAVTGGGGVLVNGSAATLIVDAGGGTGNRMSVWSYVMQAADVTAGAKTMELNLATTEDEGIVVLLNAFDLRMAGTTANVDYRAGTSLGTVIDTTVTTSTTDQVIATLAMGTQGNFSGALGSPTPTYALGTEKDKEQSLDVNNNRGFSFNLYEPGAAAVHNQSVTGDGLNRLAAISMVLE